MPVVLALDVVLNHQTPINAVVQWRRAVCGIVARVHGLSVRACMGNTAVSHAEWPSQYVGDASWVAVLLTGFGLGSSCIQCERGVPFPGISLHLHVNVGTLYAVCCHERFLG